MNVRELQNLLKHLPKEASVRVMHEHEPSTLGVRCARILFVRSNHGVVLGAVERRKNTSNRRQADKEKCSTLSGVRRKVQSVAEWNFSHKPIGKEYDDMVFMREILPKLRCCSALVIQEATGLSIGYCTEVKYGSKIPHPRWWKLLSDIAKK